MSAFIDLAKFCGDHPEIRAHKEIGRLLQEVAQEINKHRTENERFLKANIEVARLNTNLQVELQDAREHLERLLEATEDFLALPPDDMKDFMPYGQPTTASDCRLLTAAHRMASEWMQKDK